MNKINWKLRIKNKATLAALLAACVTLVYTVLGMAGVVPAVSQSAVMEALAMLLARQPGDTLAVYIGDDETDEDAFAFLQGRGLGIRVGRLPATTAAAGTLPDCQAVVELLCTWRSLLA